MIPARPGKPWESWSSKYGHLLHQPDLYLIRPGLGWVLSSKISIIIKSYLIRDPHTNSHGFESKDVPSYRNLWKMTQTNDESKKLCARITVLLLLIIVKETPKPVVFESCLQALYLVWLFDICWKTNGKIKWVKFCPEI